MQVSNMFHVATEKPSAIACLGLAATLAVVMLFSGYVHTTSAAIQSPSVSAMNERADLIGNLREQNLADFEAMKQAPGLYTGDNPVGVVQKERAEIISSLQALNEADIVAMKQAPGLYTAD